MLGGTLNHRSDGADRVAQSTHGCDGAICAAHQGGITLDGTDAGECPASSGVEQGIVLEKLDGPLDDIEGRRAPLEGWSLQQTQLGSIGIGCALLRNPPADREPLKASDGR